MSTATQELPLSQSRMSQVDLWLLTPEQIRVLAPRAPDFLSEAEQKEGLRLKDPSTREHWAGRQVALRLVLSSYVGLEPAALRLVRDARGKPELDGQSGPKFSVSACEGWWLAAFSDQELGVDLECVRPGVDIEAFARQYFNENELACLQAAGDGQERLRLFYRYWTRKEALLKLHGVGVAGLPALRDLEHGASGWLEDLELQEGLATSLAMPRPPAWVQRRTWIASETAGPVQKRQASGNPLTLKMPVDLVEAETAMEMEGQSKHYSMLEMGPEEYDRLDKQALLWLHLEQPTLLESLPKAGHFVDLGCGTGLLADAVAGACPDAHVHGFDIDPLAVEKARLRYGGRPDLRFDHRRVEQGPPKGLPLADVAVLRLVLMHLANPGQAIAAARTWLKPGGILHIIEADDRGIALEPAVATLPELLDLMQEVQIRRGGSRRLGGDLAALLTSGGWSVVGRKEFVLDPMATAAAVPKVFLPVVEFYLAEADRLGLLEPDFLRRLRVDLTRIQGGYLTKATIPIFHVWAQNTVEAPQ